jgi:hypothetical protein
MMDADAIGELRARIVAAGLYVSKDGRMKPRDMALWLEISESTLRRWRSEGKGPRARRQTLNGSAWSYSIEGLL